MPSKMDHVADVAAGGVQLYRLSQQYPLPDFVKTAEIAKHCVVPAGAVVTIYADPPRKQFPCHTKVSTFLSHLFYTEKQAEFHPKDRARIEARLNSYADHWAIRQACDEVRALWEERHKTAEARLPDSAYAYVWVGDNGVKDRSLPLRSAAEVKAASEWLHTYRDAIPYSDRRVVAGKILEKAARFGAGLGESMEFLEKQAGRGVCDPAEVVDMIEKRAMLVPRDAGVTYDEDNRPQGGLRQQFLGMAESIRNSPRLYLQPESLVKLAETVDQLDRLLGIAGKYTDAIRRPEDVIFSATFAKAAAERVQQVVTQTGRYYEKEALTKLALADLRELFGDEFAQRVGTPLGEVDAEKMAEEVTALPRPDAQLLDGLLSDNGITPVMTKAAAAKHGFSTADMSAIAAHYG